MAESIEFIFLKAPLVPVLRFEVKKVALAFKVFINHHADIAKLQLLSRIATIYKVFKAVPPALSDPTMPFKEKYAFSSYFVGVKSSRKVNWCLSCARKWIITLNLLQFSIVGKGIARHPVSLPSRASLQLFRSLPVFERFQRPPISLSQ